MLSDLVKSLNIFHRRHWNACQQKQGGGEGVWGRASLSGARGLMTSGKVISGELWIPNVLLVNIFPE